MKLSTAVRLLPEPSLYLTEETPYQTPSLASMTSSLARARLDCILTTLFAERHRQHHPDRCPAYVFKLRPAVTMSHFELAVAGQRVSSRQAVVDMENHVCPPADGVSLPPALMKEWRRRSRLDQELMANCLLQAVAFYKLLMEPNE